MPLVAVEDVRHAARRQKTWITRADIEGLRVWQEAFGRPYVATRVFAYWRAGDPPDDNGWNPGAAPAFTPAGRAYRFWLVPLAEYADHHRPLSKRRATVSVPRAVFRRIRRPLESVWPAAPC